MRGLSVRRTASPSVGSVILFALSAPVLIRLRFSVLIRFLERIASRAETAAELDAVQSRIEQGLRISGRVMRHNCFTRGLTRFYFLRRAGADVQLVFGMRPNGEGHCWVRLG